ncbi:hypothetical protein PTSG_06022 [Salpingoeca rosetta]|uniref:HIT-type domain-containing protein n=1 Tax=Salpingoeca rosetta (strain ATCC 50818 / BSB-021) TaxID=946362 RepID=F2UDG2_SALR5|nr:uncharacterized protein PTSG_06022 [Salpingoeca rosetta]EGD74657.1 hypothetical protein PTSG_06022 [Salpingoeca rosetta]|eukprot:XP_004992914.1 hypothetical protein PTSG_06022 [Salpingoeca rosetta]
MADKVGDRGTGTAEVEMKHSGDEEEGRNKAVVDTVNAEEAENVKKDPQDVVGEEEEDNIDDDDDDDDGDDGDDEDGDDDDDDDGDDDDEDDDDDDGDDEDDDDETPTTATTTVCAMCGAAWKYRCPACGTLSCSLPCVKAHKKETGCTGVRARSQPVKARDNLTQDVLFQDFRLLEEAHRLVGSAKRGPHSRDAHARHYKKPRIIKEAQARGIDLRLMPAMFSRHSENTTSFDFRKRTIRWHIDWVFPEADVSFPACKSSGKAKLRVALGAFVDRRPDNAERRHRDGFTSGIIEPSKQAASQHVTQDKTERIDKTRPSASGNGDSWHGLTQHSDNMGKEKADSM